MKRLLCFNLMVSSLALGPLHAVRADERGGANAATNTDRPASGRTERPRTAETRYGWSWLAEGYDKDGDGVVARGDLSASDDVFARLDRTWDGKLTADDFDWSEKSVLRLQKDSIFALSKAVDTNGDGRIDADEWREMFARAVEEKGYLTDDDLEKFIFLPRVAKAQREGEKRPGRGEFATERGLSKKEAPKLGELAPDFSLSSPDGGLTVRLSSFREKKPVVLIFGSFT